MRILVFWASGMLVPLLAACVTLDGAAPPTRPETLLYDNDALASLRGQVQAGAAPDETKLLEAIAREHLGCGPFSVTLKAGAPTSGDKHDYMSLAPYYWPNPATKDHLPYVRRDGETNPETKLFGDETALYDMTECVSSLGFVAYLLDDHAAGEAAARLMRTWFLDPATKMNPHLRFANARKGHPGSQDGRAIGIEVGRVFPRIVDAIKLLEAAGFLPSDDAAGLKAWFSAYLTWLITSAAGHEVAREENNIGIIYQAQVADLALYVGHTDVARTVVTGVAPRLIDATIAPDGRQPQELERTRSWPYSHTALRHLFYLGTLSDRLRLRPRLWDYASADGRSIRRALDFLVPYATKQARWPFPQIEPYNGARTAPFLLAAARIWRDRRYGEIGNSLLAAADAKEALLARLGSLEPIP